MSLSLTRKLPLSTLVFKTLSGLGIGAVGTVIVLIFVFAASASVKTGQAIGPFFSFMAIVMALLTSIITNSVAITAFTLIDREKYPPVRPVLQHVTTLNIIIFIFLLPIYVFAATKDNQTVFLIVALQLILSAQASAFALELSAGTNQRENYLGIYSVTFGMVLATIFCIAMFAIAAAATSTVSADTGRATNTGATFVLLSILPITWMLFGFTTTVVEMVYKWMYEVFGVDYLSRDDPTAEV